VVLNATQILHDLRHGDRHAANRLLPLVYDELKARAAAYFKNQNAGHTLQPTALVHEAYLRLIDQTNPQWENRAHFLAVAATAMRQILVDHARTRRAAKRGGLWNRLELSNCVPEPDLQEVDVVGLDESLVGLAKLDSRQAKIVELRFFAGLTIDEVAQALDVSSRTIELDWKMAKAWLTRDLKRQGLTNS
jgi:RNA polymerase sigma-70 factor, ECF subfamily